MMSYPDRMNYRVTNNKNGLNTFFLLVITLQFILFGYDIISKTTVDKAMSPCVFTVYRHVVAATIMAPIAIYYDGCICILLFDLSYACYLLNTE